MQNNRAKKALIAATLLMVLVCLSCAELSDALSAPSIDSVEYDADAQKVIIQGTTDSPSVWGWIDGPKGHAYTFAFITEDGRFSGRVNIEGAQPGAYEVTVRNNAGGDKASFVIPDPADVKIVPSSASIRMYIGDSQTLTFSVEGCDPTFVKTTSSNSDIVSVGSALSSAGTVTVSGNSIGTATIIAEYRSASAMVTVDVIERPAVDKEYRFFIQMVLDADKVSHPVYTQSMLESGFTITAVAKNAADALEKACDENGIPLVQYSDGTLKGWITSMFGLGDVNLGDGVWKYWVQYYEGSYNSWTLGYYTNGGNFQLIYNSTKLEAKITGAPSGSLNVGETRNLKVIISPDNREPSGSESVTWESSDESVATISDTGTVTAIGIGTAAITVKLDYGASKILEDSITVTVVQKEERTEEHEDGSKTVIVREDIENGTKETRTEYDAEGNEVSTKEIVSTETTDSSGNTSTVKRIDQSTADKSVESSVEVTVRNGETTASATMRINTGVVGTDAKALKDATEKLISQTGEALKEAGADGGMPADAVLSIGFDSPTAEIPPSVIAPISEAGIGLETELKHGTVHLDAAALKGMSGDESTRIELSPADRDSMTEAQSSTAGSAPVYDVRALVGGTEVRQLSGTATVRIPYALPEGVSASDVRVFHIDDAGNKETMETSYDEISGKVIFRTTHFSLYMIGTVADSTDGGDEDGEKSAGIDLGIVAIIAVAAIAIAAVLYIVIRKR